MDVSVSYVSLMSLISLSLISLQHKNADSLTSGPEGSVHACPGNSVSNPDAPNCLILAVEELSYFFPALGEFACAYIKYQEDKNVDNYREALEKLVFVLKCIGCHADNIFGKDHAIEDLLEGVGETGSKSGEAVVKLLNSLGLDEAALKIVCALGEKLLKSECLQKALGNIAPDVLKDLIALYCKLKGSGAADSDAAAADAAAGLTKLTGKLGCALAEVLGLEDADLEKTLGSLSKEYLQALVENLLKLTGKVDLASKTLCTVLNPVIGK